MNIRVELTEEDVELLVKLLDNIGSRPIFSQNTAKDLAVSQRVEQIKEKFSEAK